MSAVIGVATSTGLINSILSSDGKTIVDGSDITILTKLIQKMNDTKLTFLKETKMLFFTLDVVLESVLLRKYINKKAHIYTLTSRCELFFVGAGVVVIYNFFSHNDWYDNQSRYI